MWFYHWHWLYQWASTPHHTHLSSHHTSPSQHLYKPHTQSGISDLFHLTSFSGFFNSSLTDIFTRCPSWWHLYNLEYCIKCLYCSFCGFCVILPCVLQLTHLSFFLCSDILNVCLKTMLFIADWFSSSLSIWNGLVQVFFPSRHRSFEFVHWFV